MMKRFFVFICTIATLNSNLISFCSCFQFKNVYISDKRTRNENFLPLTGSQSCKPLLRSPSLLSYRVVTAAASNIVKNRSGNIIANAIGIVVAVVEPSILGGVLSGGLHAVTGSD